VLDDAIELLQRREFVRVIAAKRVVLEDDEGEVIAEALTVDISGGGIRVRVPRKVELPSEGRVFFSLFLGLTDYDDEVTGTAQIVDLRPDNQVALAFEHIARSDQERLIRFVFERQRAALRVTRGDTI
jgi:c-di-GMP-binding flagellar brake protein YcgR